MSTHYSESSAWAQLAQLPLSYSTVASVYPFPCIQYSYPIIRLFDERESLIPCIPGTDTIVMVLVHDALVMYALVSIDTLIQ